jgi:hypothetical protein
VCVTESCTELIEGGRHQRQGGRPRKNGHAVDALASSAEEGRGQLRKASGSRYQAVIRRSPNGATHHPFEGMIPRCECIAPEEGTAGTETSKVPRGKESIPEVAASEEGRAQTTPDSVVLQPMSGVGLDDPGRVEAVRAAPLLDQR